VFAYTVTSIKHNPFMTPENKAELAALITRAENEGKWLHCHYQNMWFSPTQLRAENASGNFVWGVANWTLRDPEERLAQLKHNVKLAVLILESFEREMRNQKGL
jgi:hypothetical protein